MLHLLFIFPIFTIALSCIRHQAGGRWIIDRDDPLCWQTSGSRFNTIAGIGPLFHSKMDSLLGFVEDANVSHSFLVGLFCFPSCWLVLLLLLIAFVGGPLREGWGSLFVDRRAAAAWRQWTSCGTDATLQLLKQSTELSKNTITLFLTWIRKKTNIRTWWGPKKPQFSGTEHI